MALTLRALRLLAPLLPGRRVLSLGYPDLVARADEIAQLFGYRPARFTDFGRWHGVEHPLPETAELFDAIGARLDCVDIRPSRGVERVVDLNYPCELGIYDLVLDAGTVEHCFNIAQAILNAAGAVAPGGWIYHSPPLSMTNHGFYNLNPTLLHDFYEQNGWRLELLVGANAQGKFKVPHTDRFVAPSEALLYCIARRESAAPLKYPTQSKYLKNPALT
jgi:hypothetical protein